VYSEAGRGTTFKLYLPRVDQPAERIEVVRTAPESLNGDETVLLVEDEEVVRRLARKMLEPRGYTVLLASSAAEALRVIAESADRDIDLLITDVVMPGMSGRQLVEALARDRPRMRVIYMSGYTDDTIVNHGVLAAGVHFIQKPFTPDALARKVRQVLDGQIHPVSTSQ
jgi:CheY-like chemotaxis protein